MNRKHFLLVLILASVIGISARAEEVTVAAAISLKDSLEAMRPEYESRSGDHLKFTFASSGQLAAQVQAGAPIDLFLSAARMQVDYLKQSKKTEDASAVVFAGNEMVLVVPAGAKNPPTSFESLGDEKVQRIAVGEPKTVPAGDYARQVIDHLALADKLKGKLIYGTNVRQVLQYVEAGEVDAGLVYLSDAQLSGNKVKTAATARAEWHKPIEYWGVVIAGSANAGGAKHFLEYLQTEPAQKILKANGFTGPATRPTMPAQ